VLAGVIRKRTEERPTKSAEQHFLKMCLEKGQNACGTAATDLFRYLQPPFKRHFVNINFPTVKKPVGWWVR
jgi:hypothetical protein